MALETRILVAGVAALAALYAAIWMLARIDTGLLVDLWFMPAIGVLGATIANTSGTGGGVVFVPVFNILRIEGVLTLSPAEITAASFLIQCFGMTMGALRWSGQVVSQDATGTAEPGTPVRPRDFAGAVAGVLLISLPVMLVTQRINRFDADLVLIGFKTFSILLGIALVLTAWTVNRHLPEQTRLQRIDLCALMLLAVPGGFVTALFSVGVGELVALYLFIRHYPILMSTGVATVVSAISVLSGAVWPVTAGLVPWEVVALAAPGAVIGGFVARPLALWLGSLRLKTLDGGWIIASSLYLIALRVAAG